MRASNEQMFSTSGRGGDEKEEEEDDFCDSGSSAAAAQPPTRRRTWLPSSPFPLSAAAAPAPPAAPRVWSVAAAADSFSRKSPLSSGVAAPAASRGELSPAVSPTSPYSSSSSSATAAAAEGWPSSRFSAAAASPLSLPCTMSSAHPTAPSEAAHGYSPTHAPAVGAPGTPADSVSAAAAASSYWASSSSSFCPAAAASSSAAATQRLNSMGVSASSSSCYWPVPSPFSDADVLSSAAAAPATTSSSARLATTTPATNYWASSSPTSFSSLPPPSPIAAAAFSSSSSASAAASSFTRPPPASYWGSSSSSSSFCCSASSSSSAAVDARPADSFYRPSSLAKPLCFSAPPRPSSFSFSPLPLPVIDSWEKQPQERQRQQQQWQHEQQEEQGRRRGMQEKGIRRRKEAGGLSLSSGSSSPVVSAYITNLWAYVDICPRGFSRQQMYLIARSFRCSEYSSKTAQAVLIRLQRPACTAVLATSGRLSVMGGLTQQQAVWQAFRIAYKLRYRTLWKFCANRRRQRNSEDLMLGPDTKKKKQQGLPAQWEGGKEEDARPQRRSSSRSRTDGDGGSSSLGEGGVAVIGWRGEGVAETWTWQQQQQQESKQQPTAGLQQHRTSMHLQSEETKKDGDETYREDEEKEEGEPHGRGKEETLGLAAGITRSVFSEEQQHVENEELRQNQLKMELRHKASLLQQYVLQYVCDPSIQFLPQQVHVQQMVCCLQLRGSKNPHPDVNKIAKHPLLAGRVLQTKDGISIKIPLPPRLPAAVATTHHSPSSPAAAVASSSSGRASPDGATAAAALRGGGAVAAADAAAAAEGLTDGGASSSLFFGSCSERAATASAVDGNFFAFEAVPEEESDVAAELFAGLEETSTDRSSNSSCSRKPQAADMLLLEDRSVARGDAIARAGSVEDSGVFFSERDMHACLHPTERQVHTDLLVAQGRSTDPTGRPAAAAEAAGGTCVIYRSSGRGLVLGCRNVEEIYHVIRFIAPALADA